MWDRVCTQAANLWIFRSFQQRYVRKLFISKVTLSRIFGQYLTLNSLLVKRQIDNPSPGAVTVVTPTEISNTENHKNYYMTEVMCPIGSFKYNWHVVAGYLLRSDPLVTPNKTCCCNQVGKDKQKIIFF